MKPLLILVCFALAGCSLVSWHPFGTPVSREQKAAQRVEYIKADLLDAVQADVHRATIALQSAPDSQAVRVASDFAAHAGTLIDQARGAPTSAEVAKWQDMVTRLIADDESARKELAVERSQTDALSQKLEQAQVAKEQAEVKLAQYTSQNEWLANAWRWAKRILIGGVVLWLGAQVLALAAKFYPPAAALSLAANGVIAPVHTIFHTAAVKAREVITSELTAKQ